MTFPETGSSSCPACGAANRSGAKFCGRCGTRFSSASASVAAPPMPQGPSFGERAGEWFGHARARFQAWRAGQSPRGRLLTVAGAAAAFVIIAGGAAYAEWTPLKLFMFGVEGADFLNAPIDVSGTDCANSQLSAAGMGNVPLTDGSFSITTPYPYSFAISGAPQYGNVSGDLGKGEAHKAVFLADCGSGADKNHVLFVYGASGGALKRLAAVTLGIGSAGLVHRVSLEDGVIKVEQLTGDSGGTATGLITNTYAWLGNQLVRTGGENVVSAPSAVATDTTTPTGGTLQEASFTYFEQQLAPYGTWTKHPRWGDVWKPRGVPADFRPYQDGHWQNTDDYGTVWVSDYAWGDIPFHYGRWGYDASYGGWLWVPGYTWAPAWVSWREGGGNVGWLPMVPDDSYDGSGAYPYSDADDYGYADVPQDQYLAMWVFVPEDRVFWPHIHEVVARGGYRDAYAHSFGHTRYAFDHGRIVNRSFDVARYEHRTGQRVAATHAASLFHRGVPMQGSMRGRAVSMREASHAGPVFGHAPHNAVPAPVGRGGEHMALGRQSPFGAHGMHNAPLGVQSGERSNPFNGAGRVRRTRLGEQPSAFGNRAATRSPFGGGIASDAHEGPSPFSLMRRAQTETASPVNASFGGGMRAQRTPPAFGGGFTRPAPVQQQPRIVNQPQVVQSLAPERCGKHCRR